MKEQDQGDPNQDQEKKDLASAALFSTFFLAFRFHEKSNNYPRQSRELYDCWPLKGA
jgi:hypothetical protein